MRYSEVDVLQDLKILQDYVGTRKSDDSDLMVAALDRVRSLLKIFKIDKPDLRVLYSIFTRIIYVSVFIKIQSTPTGRKPSGTNKAYQSARNIVRWIRQITGEDFPEHTQEPIPEDKSQKLGLVMWHYIVTK